MPMNPFFNGFLFSCLLEVQWESVCIVAL